MNKWLMLHRYKKLVLQGEARPICCPNCKNELAFIPDINDEPVLWCPYDDNGFTPGAEFWGDIRAVVAEFYLE